MYEATVTLKYTSKWEHKGGIYDDEMLPEENITFEVPAQDLNSIQLFNLFGKFMLSMGHNLQGIDKGALSLVFNDMRSMEDMRKAAEEYDLKLEEDLSIDEKWKEQNKVEIDHWEKRYWEVRKNLVKSEKEIRDLKAKLSRLENPDNPNYTDEELDAMTEDIIEEASKPTAQTLKNAQVVCHDCGSKYGIYSVGCSSTWEDKCGVCGETKGVTEVRDYNWLKKGIDELSK